MAKRGGSASQWPSRFARGRSGFPPRAVAAVAAWTIGAWAVALWILVAGARASEHAIQVDDIEQVIQKWHPDQHLFVKGDIGLNSSRLDELEQWLDQHGPNWTVVLMQDSAGESYITPDGRHYTGLDAVEHALERGLQDQTGYGRLENPVTGERNGCAFLLSLMDRSFTYYSSEAQDRRGLGQSHWRGELDRPAYRAMRSGGRIFDAVSDTVSSINHALAKRIADEQAASERALQERERAVQETREKLQDVHASIARVADRRQALLDGQPTATGPLAHPPLADWRSALATINDQLTVENVRQSQQKLAEIRNEVDRYLNALHEYADYDAQAAKLADAIRRANAGPNQVAAPLLVDAQKAWDQARTNHANAEWHWPQQLQTVSQLLEQATTVATQEQQRIAMAQARAARNRQLAVQGGCVLAVALVVGLVVLNRRRRPLREEVIARLRERQQQVRSALDGMFQLMQRAHVVIGKKHELDRRGCKGETRRLSEQTISDVDNLFVMSRSVERVIRQAEELVHPNSLWHSVVHPFRKSPLRRALELLTSRPIRFRPDDGIQLLGPTPTGEPAQLIGDVQDCEEFDLTFEELLNEFQQRSKRASNNLDLVEHSWGNLAPSLDLIQQKVATLEERESKLEAETEKDGYFDLATLFDQLLPAALEARDAAEGIGTTDPVRAMEGPVALAMRRVDEAMEIAELVTAFRTESMPGLCHATDRLQQTGHQVTWVGDALDACSQTLTALIETARDQSVHAALGEFGRELASLADRVSACVAIVERYRTDIEPTLATSHQRLESVRNQLAEALRTPPLEVLREEGFDPDVSLRDAQRQLSAAKAAIDRGAAKAGTSALDEVVRSDARANDIISDTLRAFEQHESEVKRLWHKADQIFAKHAQHERLLDRMMSEYALDALKIQWADPDFPDPDATIANHALEAEKGMIDARAAIDTSNDDFRAARILRAAQRRRDAESCLDHVDTRYSQIQQQSARLQEQIKANARQSQTLTKLRETLEREAEDFRTRRSTQTQLHDALRGLDLALRVVNAPRGQRSPFLAGSELAAAESLLMAVQQGLRADRDLHAEATRSLEAALNQLATACQLVGIAETDQVPDSSATTKAVAQIQSLQRACDNLKHSLQSPHADWSELDERADELTRVLGSAVAALRGELEKGQQVVEELERAAREVRQAASWSGSYGVTINGSPGSDQLHQSRAALDAGNYDQALRLAQVAAETAAQAVRQAELQVLARRRESERRAAELRRRRQRNSMSLHSSSSLGSFGSHRSSSSGSSIHSGSRSSFRSGSSFSRSGW